MSDTRPKSTENRPKPGAMPVLTSTTGSLFGFASLVAAWCIYLFLILLEWAERAAGRGFFVLWPIAPVLILLSIIFFVYQRRRLRSVRRALADGPVTHGKVLDLGFGYQAGYLRYEYQWGGNRYEGHCRLNALQHFDIYSIEDEIELILDPTDPARSFVRLYHDPPALRERAGPRRYEELNGCQNYLRLGVATFLLGGLLGGLLGAILALWQPLPFLPLLASGLLGFDCLLIVTLAYGRYGAGSQIPQALNPLFVFPLFFLLGAACTWSLGWPWMLPTAVVNGVLATCFGMAIRWRYPQAAADRSPPGEEAIP